MSWFKVTLRREKTIIVLEEQEVVVECDSWEELEERLGEAYEATPRDEGWTEDFRSETIEEEDHDIDDESDVKFSTTKAQLISLTDPPTAKPQPQPELAARKKELERFKP